MTYHALHPSPHSKTWYCGIYHPAFSHVWGPLTPFSPRGVLVKCFHTSVPPARLTACGALSARRRGSAAVRWRRCPARGSATSSATSTRTRSRSAEIRWRPTWRASPPSGWTSTAATSTCTTDTRRWGGLGDWWGWFEGAGIEAVWGVAGLGVV